MNIVQKIRKFFSFDMKTMFLFIEAYIYLGWARFLKSMPFSKIAPTLGTHMDETSLSCNESNKLILRSISEAIHIMSQLYFLGKQMSCECDSWNGNAKKTSN